LSKQEEEDEED